MTRLHYTTQTENSLLLKRVFDILKSFKLWMRCAGVENVMPVGMSSMRLIRLTYARLPILNFKLPARLPCWDTPIHARSIQHDSSLREYELKHVAGIGIDHLQSDKCCQVVCLQEPSELSEEVVIDLREIWNGPFLILVWVEAVVGENEYMPMNVVDVYRLEPSGVGPAAARRRVVDSKQNCFVGDSEVCMRQMYAEHSVGAVPDEERSKVVDV